MVAEKLGYQLVGHRLELSPVMVFLALWFGGWFWGVAGVVIAVPGLVTLKVVAEHSEHGRPLLEFLSPNFTKRFKPRFPKIDRSAAVNKTSNASKTL